MTTAAAAARAELADHLREAVRAGPAVEAAFRAVPRHSFLPEIEPVQAYQDTAITIKADDEGLPLSASTQPAMMAIMLDQLALSAGHHVLEIGTGTGFNAALIAHIVQDQRRVVTVDVDPELTGNARTRLAEAGYAAVTVVCGDGAAGFAGRAPYDRIIVTAGAWDLAPQWLAQLTPGGRIVLPLSVRGIQLSVGLESHGNRLVSRAARRCGFIRMAGAFSGPESFVALGPQPGLHAQIADGPAPDPDALYDALSAPATEVSAGFQVADVAELADLDLWLTLAEPGLARLTMMGRHETHASPAQQRIATLLPLGALAQVGGVGGLGVAALVPGGSGTHRRPFEITACGYGPGGPSLAKRLVRQAFAWDERGRPGAQTLELTAWPPGTPVAATGTDSIIIDRPHTRLALRWPTS